MNSYRKACSAVLAVMILGLLFCLPALAGEPTGKPTDLTVDGQTTTARTPQKVDTSDDDKWHFVVAPYLWFPGMSGTVGAFGHNASVHASATDVLGYFKFGIMGAVEARRNRLLIPVDYMFVRLGDNKSLPLTDLGATSINVKVTESILTPKVGYRFADTEKWKADALFGIRYWHLGQNITVNPLNVGVSPSVNWVDYNLGMRVTGALTPKVMVAAFADEGAGGSRLDYQAGGLLGYRVKPNIALQLGWRYLYVDYHGGGDKRFVFNVHESGPILGLTWGVK